MTKKPPARLSRPRTGPAAPAPAHGDGPTRPTAPTGRTEARGCPFGFRHYNCDCKPLEATTPEPADRPPLRDQIAEALYRHTMDHAAGGPARLLTRDETVLWENSLAR
ncbi:MAG TPA: hypothetical protein VFY14_16705, partial [Streptomyces sp.]|nr:hypothetical protein [Streptomyces sp.]